MQTAIVPLARIRAAFAAIQIKPMGSAKCQCLWTCICEQDGATADALEQFFDAANAQHIPIPPPMFQAKHRLEKLEPEIAKQDAYLAMQIEAQDGGKEILAAILAGYTRGEHLAADPRVKQLLQANEQNQRAKQERKQQAEAARVAERLAVFNAAFQTSQESFGTTREQVMSWLRVYFATADLAALTDEQFARAVAALGDVWWWNKKLFWSQSA
jgi:hypothetical protein